MNYKVGWKSNVPMACEQQSTETEFQCVPIGQKKKNMEESCLRA
jgi:hypothetical protein